MHNFGSLMRPFISTKTLLLFICLCCYQASSGQVCTGSLGDPSVNVNFSSGPNPGSPLAAASTSYFFTSSSCPNDGSYTVVNSTAGCFGNSWHTLPQDHTPNDDNGYMMLVNASYTPGDFYLDTVKNLCTNTTYEFAAWIVNVLLPSACGGNGIQPSLIFNIETTSGTILGTYATGNIPSTTSPTWKQYGLFFKTPANTSSVVIRLTNSAPGGCGNDLAVDDITFRPCGPVVKAFEAINKETAIDFCIGTATSVPLKADVGTGYINPAMQWQVSNDSGASWTDLTGETTDSYLFNKTAIGVYNYRLTVADGANIGIGSCRVASNLVTISIHDFPPVTVSSNSPVCEKQSINLAASGGASYTWSGPAGFTAASSNPSRIADAFSAGQYKVLVTDSFGCKNSAAVSVVTFPKPVAAASGNQTICEGKTVVLHASGGIAYVWSPSTGLSDVTVPDPVASPADSAVYTVVVTGNNGCSDTITVPLNVLKKPVADAGGDKIILKGQSVTLDAKIGGSDINFNWSPASFLSDRLSAQPIAKPINDIRYTLQVISNAGCGEASDDMFVKVYNDIYIPSAFTPNNDGLNDTWRIDGLAAVPYAHISVYDRYGKVVFETVSNNEQWDGTFKGQPLSAGAFVYVIDLKNGLPIRKGTVMILR